MIQFKISAPIKLSLFGEHAVKYGKRGLMAGINLRTKLTFTELPHSCSKGVIHMYFPQIYLLLSIPLHQFLDFYRNCTFNENNDELYEQVLQFTIINHCQFLAEHQRAIILSFIYLLTYISHKENINIKSFYIHLSTQLVIDKDLICLASFTVCLTACFLRWSNLQKGAIDDFDSNDLNKIFLYAASCEKISRESGMADVAVCTYGSIVQHKSREILDYIPFFEMINVKILLVDSKQTQNLEIQTQQLTELMNKSPEAVHSIFNGIDAATSGATYALQKIGPIYAFDELSLETRRVTIMMQHNLVLTFINQNQRLLHLLNVPHFNLDKICSIAISHEFYGKYTNIGNGRYAYIWCLPNASVNRISRLSIDLKLNGFHVTETTLACSGVKIED